MKHSGLLYYVMDLVLYKDGYAHTLADLEPGGADEDQIFAWFNQLCNALGYVHAQGVVHHDIKLNNILIAPDKHVVLSDFGISRVLGEKLRCEIGTTRTMVSGVTGNLIVGTQGYMAPEVQAGQPASPAADVYALGVVFFKLLTGVWYDSDLEPDATRPTTGFTTAVKLLSDFERPWKDVLPAMLAKDPAKRPTSLIDLPRLLSNECIPSGEAVSSPLVRKSKPSTSRRPRLIPTLLIAALLLAALAVAFFFLSSDSIVDDDQLIEDAYAIPESVT